MSDERRFEAWCDPIEGPPKDGWRTFTPGPSHYMVDGVEVTKADFEAVLASEKPTRMG